MSAQKTMFAAIIFAVIIEAIGLILLAIGFESLARPLLVWPSTAAVYVIPHRVLDLVPEGALFFVGILGALIFWIFVWVIGRSILRLVS